MVTGDKKSGGLGVRNLKMKNISLLSNGYEGDNIGNVWGGVVVEEMARNVHKWKIAGESRGK